MPSLAGERFYLGVSFSLLSRGSPSMKTCVPFKVFSNPTFREACIAYGLTEHDNEWHNALKKQSIWQLVIRCATSLSHP